MTMAAMLATGCATANKMNSVSIGMTKQEVIGVLGPPTSTSAKEGLEYLNYLFSDDGLKDSPYFVRVINGKVDSYGRLGDFDSTKTSETKSTIDLNIKK
jgi:outer membrane protein assembly factor BamE (lipoprotein component of BamABCDE complex)